MIFDGPRLQLQRWSKRSTDVFVVTVAVRGTRLFGIHFGEPVLEVARRFGTAKLELKDRPRNCAHNLGRWMWQMRTLLKFRTGNMVVVFARIRPPSHVTQPPRLPLQIPQIAIEGYLHRWFHRRAPTSTTTRVKESTGCSIVLK